LLGSGIIGSGVHVEDNTLAVNGPGIQCSLNFVWIERNRITGTVVNDRSPTGSGITLMGGFDENGSDECQLLANQVSVYPDAGILVNSPVRDFICKLNIIDRCGQGIVVQPTAPVGQVSIENNHLNDIGSLRASPAMRAIIAGISVRNTRAATVAGNALRRIGVDAARGVELVAGIAHFAVRGSRVTGNDIAEVGPVGALAGATLGGIVINGPYIDAAVSDNQVARDRDTAGPDAAQWFAVLVDEPNAQRPIVHVGDFSAVSLNAARMLVIDGVHAFTEELANAFTDAAAAVPRGSSVSVRGNVLRARGAASVVALEAGGDIQFGDNRC
jgi:hypothetical protein